MAVDEQKWYYTPSTGEVTQEKVSTWNDRMGPYDTEAEAKNAMEIAKQRNEQADRAEDEDDNWGEPASWDK